MNVALRGLTALVGGSTIALAAAALATPASAAPAGDQDRAQLQPRTSQPGTTPASPCDAATSASRRSTTSTSRRRPRRAATVPRACSRPTTWPRPRPPTAPASGSTSSTPTTTRTPSPTSRPTARQFGLPACTTANGCFQKLNQTGATSPLPTGDTGWAGEDPSTSTWSRPSARSAHHADRGQRRLGQPVHRGREAATLGGKFVSMSWGGAEAGTEATYDSYFNASGVVYTASTGDDAYSRRELPGVVGQHRRRRRHVAVDRVELPRLDGEGLEDQLHRGTGSGCSSRRGQAVVAEHHLVLHLQQARRSDVSAVADPATGVAVYQTYGGSGWAVYGGTSASAPIIASIYALAGRPSSSTKPASLPYAHTANLNDVTSGNNGTCSPSAALHRGDRLGRPDRPRHARTAPPRSAAPAVAAAATPSPSPTRATRPGRSARRRRCRSRPSDSGGAALTYSATGLPTGLSINASSGLISGTPSAAGTFSPTVTAKDSTNASGSTSFTWTISTSGGGGCSGPEVHQPGLRVGCHRLDADQRRDQHRRRALAHRHRVTPGWTATARRTPTRCRSR